MELESLLVKSIFQQFHHSAGLSYSDLVGKKSKHVFNLLMGNFFNFSNSSSRRYILSCYVSKLKKNIAFFAASAIVDRKSKTSCFCSFSFGVFAFVFVFLFTFTFFAYTFTFSLIFSIHFFYLHLFIFIFSIDIFYLQMLLFAILRRNITLRKIMQK